MTVHAKGGLGIVYKAWHAGLRRHVAVKFLQEQYAGDRELRDRFLREAEITAGLEHPGIVPIYGIGQDSAGRSCYVMRFIEGPTLEEAVTRFHSIAGKGSDRRARNRAFRDLLLQFLSASEAVAHAHGKGVLHRDLKPSNIIVGPLGQVVLLDWGLGKCGSASGDDRSGDTATESSSTATGSFRTRARMGTAGYMSPEQQATDWQNVDARSDVFSLGVTLYLLLTGVTPFRGRSSAEVLGKVARGEFRPPRQADATISPGLEAICLKALSLRREDRYPTALELVDDLKSWLAGEPVSAWSEPLTLRLRRWIGRHQTAVSLGVVSTLALAGIAAVAGYLLHRASVVELERRSQAEQHAEHLREESIRHTEQLNDVKYNNAEKTALEIIRQKQPGWVNRSIEQIQVAANIPTPMKSLASLRNLAAEAHGGFDLQQRCKLTSINSACAAFSRDGKWLAVGEHHGKPDFRVQVFDVATFALVTESKIRGDGQETKRTGVFAIEFSPDGHWLAGGFRDGKIVAWNTKSWHQPPTVVGQHTKSCRGLGFTPDGSILVSGGAEGAVKLWDTASRFKESCTFLAHDVLSSLMLSPDGRLLALGCDTSGQVVELASLREDPANPRFVYRHAECHHQFRFHPDGRTFASTAGRRIVSIGGYTDKFNKTTLVDPNFGVTHSDEVNGLAFHPGGSLLVSGSADNSLKVWDLAAGELILTLPNLTHSLVGPAFSPDGSKLAVASSDGTVLYDVVGVATMTTHRQPEVVQAFAFVPAENDPSGELATVTLESDDTQKKERLGIIACEKLGAAMADREINFRSPPDSGTLTLAFDAHPVRRLTAYNGDHRVGLYDMDLGRGIAAVAEPKSTHLAFSQRGERLWGVIDDVRVVSWTVPELTPETSWQQGPSMEVEGRVGLSCLAAGSDWVVAGTRAGRVHFLRAGEGTLARTARVDSPVQCISVSTNDGLAACGLVSGVIVVFRPATGERLAEIVAHQDMVNSVAFSRDGRLLASGGRDRAVAIWDLNSGHPQELLRIPAPSGRPVLSVKFSPDGGTLAMLVQNERAVRLWNLNELRTRLKRLGIDWDDRPQGLQSNSAVTVQIRGELAPFHARCFDAKHCAGDGICLAKRQDFGGRAAWRNAAVEAN